MDEQAVRSWCEGLTARLPCQHIAPGGVPYLDRFFLAGWRPGTQERIPAVYLHHFLASDPVDQVHSHPWPAFCLLLVGGYREHRCQGEGQVLVRDFHQGDVNTLEPGTRHRVQLLTPDVWTLVVRGPASQPWAFFPGCQNEA